MDIFIRFLYSNFKLVILVFCFYNLSCQTATLKVASEPDGADVYVQSQSQAPRNLGKTPLSINDLSLTNYSEPLQLSIIKDGFNHETVLIPTATLSREVNIQVKLEKQAGAKISTSDETLQKVASQVALSQLLIKQKKFDEAEKSISALTIQYPNVSIFYELLGNVFYLQKDLGKAILQYRKAVTLNPGKTDTSKLIEKIENLRPDLKTTVSNGVVK